MDFPQPSFFPSGLITLSTMSNASVGCMPLIGGGGASVVWPTINLALYIPFRIASPFTFNSFSAVVGTSSGNLDMGVYSADGTKIISTGSTASGANIKTVSVASTKIGPGLFYLAMSCDNTTIAFQSFTLTATAKAALLASIGISQQATAFALPATATFATMAQASIPIFGISNRSVI